MVLGIRGMPNIQGGVETHAEQLYPRLVKLGCSVNALVRTPSTARGASYFQGVGLRRIWAPRTSGLEALVHSLLGVAYASLSRPDILHIHAVGPAIVAPLARLAGLKVVVTHHGADYERDKWNAFSRWVLRLGESWGMRFSNARIAISRVIASSVNAKYGASSVLVPNGVVVRRPAEGADFPRTLALEPGRYFLQVSRMVPEKRQADLIAAFRRSGVPGWKLVLAGQLDGSSYSDAIARSAEPDIVLPGFVTGRSLEQLYSCAGAFVLPSSHEGLPIALLEALSYGLPVLASDIPANLEVGLDAGSYFPVGNVDALASALRKLSLAPQEEAGRHARVRLVREKYDWDRVAEQTMEVYRSVLAGGDGTGETNRGM